MNIGTQIGNINGENIRINYINANHLVQLYDVRVLNLIQLLIIMPILDDDYVII